MQKHDLQFNEHTTLLEKTRMKFFGLEFGEKNIYLWARICKDVILSVHKF